MSQTNVASGSNLSVKQYSAAFTAQFTRAPGNLKALTGPPPDQSDAEANIKLQTSPQMPFVRITDLSSTPRGDTVSVDAADVVTGKPIMGDRNVEGRGVRLSSSSFEVKINLGSFVVDAGGKMSRQRTRHDLLSWAKAEAIRYWPNHIWCRSLAHSAGARGFQDGVSWAGLPLASDADFDEIMINPVKAPTYNRHLVVNGTNITRGGLQLASLATTDVWKLSVLDNLALFLESQETQLPPPRFHGDEQAYDSPLKGVLWLSPSSYNSLITDATAGTNMRAFQGAVEQRQKYAKDSSIFRGECGIWRGILVKKLAHTIAFPGSSAYQYITVANRLTETETAGTVAALSASFQAERAILMGAQALARCEGMSNSGLPGAILENRYNADQNVEYITQFMGGESKFRFSFPNTSGDKEPTDNGIYVIDAAAGIVA